jgi:hypothetical protein
MGNLHAMDMLHLEEYLCYIKENCLRDPKLGDFYKNSGGYNKFFHTDKYSSLTLALT